MRILRALDITFGAEFEVAAGGQGWMSEATEDTGFRARPSNPGHPAARWMQSGCTADADGMHRGCKFDAQRCILACIFRAFCMHLLARFGGISCAFRRRWRSLIATEFGAVRTWFHRHGPSPSRIRTAFPLTVSPWSPSLRRR